MPASKLPTACNKLRTQFLEGLTGAERDMILGVATVRHFPAGAVISAQGEPADRLFLLTKGRARLTYTTEEGKRIILVWLAPGQVLGVAALNPKPMPYLVNTEAVEPCATLCWDRATIRNLTARLPKILENTLATASEYLAWYCAAHGSLGTQSAEQRLAHVVKCLAQAIGREVPGGVELDVINEELAGAANITSFTTSRLLNKWQRSGAVRKRRGKILLRLPENLTPARP